jgi:hypothetical protein
MKSVPCLQGVPFPGSLFLRAARPAAATMVTQPMDGETVNDSLPEIKANLATLGNVDPKSVTMLISGGAHTARRAKGKGYPLTEAARAQ